MKTEAMLYAQQQVTEFIADAADIAYKSGNLEIAEAFMNIAVSSGTVNPDIDPDIVSGNKT